MNETQEKVQFGYVSSINGSLIEIKGLENQVRLNDLIRVSNILGEVIQIYSDHVIAQCFENTNNLKLNQEVISLQEPLSMELGPGLLGTIFDGIQRPLKATLLQSTTGGFLERGVDVPSLSRTKKWLFKPLKKVDDVVNTGYVIGFVQETPLIKHKILVPVGVTGKLTYIAEEGEYTIIDELYRVKRGSTENSFNMFQKWPITKHRPYKSRGYPQEPLITGIRTIDLLFPIVKGGTVAVPGGFGTGKTVIQQSLAKWCDADVIIFVGCGERGNEIADVLKQFSEIIDPKSGRPLLDRIVLIANTSNMPVSAREASIFSGVTIGEYYRDMGYDVAVLADSTSRWAESLREISGLLEEMPAEEGYPAYLPSKISSFYERAGIVNIYGDDDSNNYGSLTIIGSVSPPSGDFSEPVTSTSKRFVQAFWALDANLAYSKHYPAINWLKSYSKYPDFISDWWYERDVYWPEIDIDWYECRKEINNILSQENELKNVTQLVGEENLPEDQQFVLFISNLIRNSFLIQNAFDPIDCFTDIKKLIEFTKIILLIYHEGQQLISQGYLIDDIKDLKVIEEILRIGQSVPNDKLTQVEELRKKLSYEIESLKLTHGAFKNK